MVSVPYLFSLFMLLLYLFTMEKKSLAFIISFLLSLSLFTPNISPVA
jgi:hypothetical protein